MCPIALTKNWHEFYITPSQQCLVMVLHRRYKGAKSRSPRTCPECGPGASPVGLGEGAKPDAPIFSLSNKEWRPERTAILVGESCLFYFPVSFGTEKLPPVS